MRRQVLIKFPKVNCCEDLFRCTWMITFRRKAVSPWVFMEWFLIT